MNIGFHIGTAKKILNTNFKPGSVHQKFNYAYGGLYKIVTSIKISKYPYQSIHLLDVSWWDSGSHSELLTDQEIQTTQSPQRLFS